MEAKVMQYISFNDYKNHLNLNGFDVDKPSREVLKCFLIAMGVNPDTIYQSEGNCSYDLIYEKDGQKYAVECKDRRFESNKYNDHCIEAVKLSSLINRKKKGEFDKIWLVSTFSDGVFAISKDIDKQENIKETKSLQCPKTTTLGDSTMMTKHLIFYEQQFKYYFCIAVMDNGEIIPHFDKKPINILQLNSNLQYKVETNGNLF